jgi:hypothetical protein
MMNRRSFLALLAAVPIGMPLLAVPFRSPVPTKPLWSRLSKDRLSYVDATRYQAVFMRPEWPTMIGGDTIITTAEEAVDDRLPAKFQHLRESLWTHAQEKGLASAAFRQQLDDLLGPYCVGVLA